MGEPIKAVPEMKLVGFIFDPKMTMQPMVDHVARKARVKLAAIHRLKQHLESDNLEQMYKAFVRSTIEYGNLVYMGAADSTKEKLDRVQHAAAKMGQFEVESLGSRRKVALIGLVFKLLGGTGRGMLNEFIPTLMEPKEGGKQRIKEAFDFRDTTRQYDRSIGGQILVVWKLFPQGLLCQGSDKGWKSAIKRCQRFLSGKKQETKSWKTSRMVVIMIIKNRKVQNCQMHSWLPMDIISRMECGLCVECQGRLFNSLNKS